MCKYAISQSLLRFFGKIHRRANDKQTGTTCHDLLTFLRFHFKCNTKLASYFGQFFQMTLKKLIRKQCNATVCSSTANGNSAACCAFCSFLFVFQITLLTCTTVKCRDSCRQMSLLIQSHILSRS